MFYQSRIRGMFKSLGIPLEAGVTVQMLCPISHLLVPCTVGSVPLRMRKIQIHPTTFRVNIPISTETQPVDGLPLYRMTVITMYPLL